jgi:hypothetical protein
MKPVEMSAKAQGRLRIRRLREPKANTGRPPKAIDKKKLEAMAAMGLTQKECAVLLDCSVDTIQRNYAEIYEQGKARCTASVRRKQFEMAIAGNPTMLIWLGKNLCGQKDRLEATGAGGSPLYQPVDREAIIERFIRAAEEPGPLVQ